MRPIYFAHGYRQREAPFAAYFSRLMRIKGLMPSLDPPSSDVNAAKLERHLHFADGLVAILSAREHGPSPHILFEISMAMRAGKPALVFVEDSLPDNFLSPSVLQSRFSPRSYIREAREHLHALELLGEYLGSKPIPRYRASGRQRSCVILGDDGIDAALSGQVKKRVIDRGYKVFEPAQSTFAIPMTGLDHFDIANADLALSFLATENSAVSSYALGVVQTALVPSILLAISDYPLHQAIPHEYQARVISENNVENALQIIDEQVELFEEDFVEIDTEGKSEKYADELLSFGAHEGDYTKDLRNHVMEVVMGDKYEAGQVGAQGPNSHAHNMTFNQVWNQAKGTIDLQALESELEQLRTEMQKSAAVPEQYVEMGAVAAAQMEAKNGDGPETLAALAKAGKWTLGIAEKIGVGIALAAVKAACGL